MKVKLFDFEHEKDLEDAINSFIENDEITVVNINYQICHFYAQSEQVFSFSALILYEKSTKKV